jgi:hypothetical protein
MGSVEGVVGILNQIVIIAVDSMPINIGFTIGAMLSRTYPM